MVGGHQGHGRATEQGQPHGFAGVNDAPLEDPAVHLLNTPTKVRLQVVLIDDLGHLAEHELEGNANVLGEVDECDVLPARLLTGRDVLVGALPVMDHVGSCEGVQLIARDVVAMAAHEVTKDECATGLGDTEGLRVGLDLAPGMHECILRECQVKSVGRKGRVLVRSGGHLDAVLQP
eukprot:scaffold5259_cov58-Attheya_sp.AAC.7